MYVRPLVVDDGLASHVVVVGALTVPVAHGIIYLIVEVDMRDPVLDGLEHESQLMVDDVALFRIVTARGQSQCRRRRRVEVAVTIVERQDRPSLTSHVVVEVARQSRRTMIVGTCEAHAVVHADPLGQFDIHLGRTVVTLETIAAHIHETTLIEIANRCIVVDLLTTASHTGIVLLREGCALIDHVVPVDIIDTIAIAVVPCHTVL